MAAPDPTIPAPAVKSLDGGPKPVLMSRPMSYRIKNWQRFQHYKNRNPAWIKFHKSLLDDLDWHRLSGEASKFLVELWLLASEKDGGELPSAERIAFRLHRTEKSVESMLSQLSHWLEHDASAPLADGKQDASLEGEGEGEGEKEKEGASAPPGLDERAWGEWQTYRRGIGKPIKSASEKAAMERLAAYGSRQAEIVTYSIAQGYQGMWEPMADAKPSGPKIAAPASDADVAATRARLAAENAALAKRLTNPELKR